MSIFVTTLINVYELWVVHKVHKHSKLAAERCPFRGSLGHVPVKGVFKEDPGGTRGTTSLSWAGNTLGVLRDEQGEVTRAREVWVSFLRLLLLRSDSRRSCIR